MSSLGPRILTVSVSSSQASEEVHKMMQSPAAISLRQTHTWSWGLNRCTPTFQNQRSCPGLWRQDVGGQDMWKVARFRLLPLWESPFPTKNSAVAGADESTTLKCKREGKGWDIRRRNLQDFPEATHHAVETLGWFLFFGANPDFKRFPLQPPNHLCAMSTPGYRPAQHSDIA